MTFAPPTLVELGRYWTDHGGVNLGIVGDAAHQATGVSYHLGRDALSAGAYSIRTARDIAGLSNAASAIDLGRLRGSLPALRTFSRALVGAAQHNAAGTSDLREIIYSPDGLIVLRWDRERGSASAPRPGEADAGHLTHTHISWYRDAETRDHTTAFRPLLEDDVSPAPITDEIPKIVTANAGHTWRDLDGKTVLENNRPALAARSSPYGVKVGTANLRAIYATVGAIRRTVLIDPATAVDPLPVDCADAVAAEHERVVAAAVVAVQKL